MRYANKAMWKIIQYLKHAMAMNKLNDRSSPVHEYEHDNLKVITDVLDFYL